MTDQGQSHSLATRRSFVKAIAGTGALTVIGGIGLGSLTALAAPGGGNDRVLVNVFLRGGADGLNIVVPYGDDDYYRVRRSIALPQESLSNLDGFFGLNAVFNSLMPIYNTGELAFVQAVGSHDPSRSHFSAMDNMDFAFGVDGWMQRALSAQTLVEPISGLSIGSATSPALIGRFGGIAMKSVYKSKRVTRELAPAREFLNAMYDASPDLLTKSAVTAAFASMDKVLGVPIGSDVEYPRTSIARDLKNAAAMIKADVGVRMVSVNFGGWDHHTDELNRMASRGKQLSEALAAFKADLADDSARVLTIVMSEFGRTANQNGSGGTDHGHGNMMMLMGGDLASAGGGRVHMANNEWVGLAEGDLYEQRDLKVTTDFRSVFAEALTRHMGMDDLSAVFPSFPPRYLGFLPEPADPGPEQQPFVAVTVPGAIQAENFDLGGVGVAFEDDSPQLNSGGAYRDEGVDIWSTHGEPGGYTVGRTRDGDWTEYTFDAATTDNYTFWLRVATGHAAPGTISVMIDGMPIGKVAPTATGWWTWQRLVVGAADLVAGTHVLRLTWGEGAQINLDRIDIGLTSGV